MTLLKNLMPACKTIDDLLKDSDFVSLHCPSTDETKGLMNIKTLQNEKV